MNRYEFESLISEYLDGSMSFNKQKEFEQYMVKNPDAANLVKNIRKTISDMSKLKLTKASDNFNDKLLSRLKTERMVIGRDKNTLFGFTPFYASVLSCLCVALFVISLQLFNLSGEPGSKSKLNQYKTSLKTDQNGKKENNLQVNKNLMVDSNIDSVKNDEVRKKPNNSNKIKFVNY